jgi:hypothetical protein
MAHRHHLEASRPQQRLHERTARRERQIVPVERERHAPQQPQDEHRRERNQGTPVRANRDENTWVTRNEQRRERHEPERALFPEQREEEPGRRSERPPAGSLRACSGAFSRRRAKPQEGREHPERRVQVFAIVDRGHGLGVQRRDRKEYSGEKRHAALPANDPCQACR